ncbi:zinc finger, CCHC-type containing protein [Tanacetum coccineum]
MLVNEAKNGIKNEPIRKAEKEETTEAPNSQPVEYYLKHMINEKLIEGLVDNHRFNDSLSGARVGKIKGRTYNLLPRGPVYEAILRKKITRKEDIEGNFKIPFEDVLVEVAEHVYPVDFVILDIKENEKKPFILGTPFLTTAKAVIKFDKGTITLRSGKSKISFNRILKSLCKDEKEIKNDIEPTVNRLVLEWEEKIKLHQEKEMS